MTMRRLLITSTAIVAIGLEFIAIPTRSTAGTLTIRTTSQTSKLLKQMDELNIAVKHLRGNCPKGIPETVVAAYERFANYILICHGAVRDAQHLQESLAHEVVHMIQDCIQTEGLSGNKSIPISTYLLAIGRRDSHVRFQALLVDLLQGRSSANKYLEDLRQKPNPTFYQMEEEAYALETRPDMVSALVKNIVAPVCGAKRQ